MVEAELLRIEKAYRDLLKQITERQAFEKNNQGPPYSDHPTTINYFDVQGYTLLQYAAALGDMQKVKDCIEKGADVNSISVKWIESPEETPIAMALKNGHVDIAEYLFNQGAICVGVHPEICGDQHSRIWLENKLKEALDARRSKQFFHDNPPSHLELLVRAAEIGDMNFIENMGLNVNNLKTQAVLNQLLVVAARYGKLEAVNFLIDKGADVNPSQSYKGSALGQAINHGHLPIVERMIEAGADVTRSDENLCSPLMIAIKSESEAIVSQLITAEIDLNATDVNGDSILHYCARCNHSEIIQKIAAVPGIQAMMNTKNIYGQLPMDIAVSKKNDAFIVEMNHDENLADIKSSVAYGYEQPFIGHHVIVTRCQYYSNMQYRDKEFFAFIGKCNGFSYLHEYYSAKGMEDYFFNTLNLISKWDGSQESLEAPFADSIEQRNFYHNLGELFEQWINDIVYLQHSGINAMELGTRQTDREKHMLLIGDDPDYQHQSLYRSPIRHEKNQSQIREILLLLSKMPINTRFEIRSTNHDTSGHIDNDHQFDYYDPNHALPTVKVSDADALFVRVMNYEYIWAKSILDKRDLMTFDIDIFCFQGQRDSLDLAHHRVFAEHEFPRNKDDVASYKSKSPNQFTPLHVAVITHSMLDLERLLKDGFCDLNAVDSYGLTALKIARMNNFDDAVMLICQHLTPEQKAGKLVEFSKESATPFVINLLNHGTDVLMKFDYYGRKTTLILELIVQNSPYCSFMFSNMPDINARDALGNTAFYYAVKYRRIGIIDNLLLLNADVNHVCDNDDSILELLMLNDQFDFSDRTYIFKNIASKLEIDSDSKKQLLSSLLRSFVTQNETESVDLALSKCDKHCLNLTDENNYHALHHAILSKNLEIALKLMATDINVNAQTKAGNTPLMMILIMGSTRVKEPRLSQAQVHELSKAILSKNPDLSLTNNKNEGVASLINELYPNDTTLKEMFDAPKNNVNNPSHSPPRRYF